MLTKFIPAALLVLAALVTTARGPWSPSVTATGTSQRQPTTAMPGTPVTPPAGIHAASLVAADDYRMNLQAGVTADAYGLPPMAEHDAARTQSMIDGFSGRRMAHGGPATPPHRPQWPGDQLGAPRTSRGVVVGRIDGRADRRVVDGAAAPRLKRRC